MRRGQWARLVLLILLLLLLGFGGYLGWATVRNAPSAAAETALIGDDVVEVAEDPWLVFRPVEETATTGLILYPGGLVPPAAYAPTARAIAEAGYLVVLVPMPLNLAVIAPDRAQAVIAAYPEIEQWAIGGHSLGGAMAARFAFEHPEAVGGLLLWASYPAEGNDLSQERVRVLSIYGSDDGLATPAEVQGAADLLPADTRFLEIAGGNHTQFGYYGSAPQRGDNPAAISRRAQQEQIVAATVAFLSDLSQEATAASSSP